MITEDDAVLALSNSGETLELQDLAEYTRRYSIPLIVITSKAGSTLTELADAVLLLPAVPEARPMGLAPTTSTTMSLALGDALAVALLERSDFPPKTSGSFIQAVNSAAACFVFRISCMKMMRCRSSKPISPCTTSSL